MVPQITCHYARSHWPDMERHIAALSRTACPSAYCTAFVSQFRWSNCLVTESVAVSDDAATGQQHRSLRRAPTGGQSDSATGCARFQTVCEAPQHARRCRRARSAPCSCSAAAATAASELRAGAAGAAANQSASSAQPAPLDGPIRGDTTRGQSDILVDS